ncbi:MAG: VCBS repeat-containing protein, partial [Bacteroidetes bacterium]|nr:VCBS repeat-containing protein [Bacteroidota bacterium]
MQSTLYQLYLHTSRKYRKFSARLKKSISTGKFYNQTRYEQNKILKRVKKLRTRLESLYLQLKIAGFTGLLLAGISSVETKAQGLGPFTPVQRLENPLRSPIQHNSWYATAPAFSDIDGDGDIDMLVGIYENFTSYLRTFKNYQVEYGLLKPAFKLAPNPPITPSYISSIYGSFNPSFVDIDGDGIDELALAVRYFDYMEFFKNDGSGNFSYIPTPATLPNSWE